MGTGEADAAATTAAARMRLLEQEFTTPRRHGDTGRPTRPSTATAPLDLGMHDYRQASVDEVVTHTRALVPEATTPPAKASAVYDWMRQHTAHLANEQRQAADAVVYRQSLEHALAIGDESVVRRQPCPACGCWGLFWNAAARRAACVNQHCTDTRGQARTWSLARLASQHIAARKTSARRAT
ncbi:hypothetical protein [Streptomyces sp. NPDC018584]|uniref:hypothetical protein n=1 Tax=unclassified Streptomyces TaxID=2593676 RepID=UPI0037AC08EC